MRDKPIGADELDKAKNQLAAAFVFGLQTVDGIAQALGRAQYVEGDWKRFVDGRHPLPGRDRRRRAAGGAQVPGRQQPHARDAGPARRRHRWTRNDPANADADVTWTTRTSRSRCCFACGLRLQPRPPSRPRPPAREPSQVQRASAPRARRTRYGLLAGRHRPHPRAGAAQTNRAGAAARPAVHAEERPRRDRGSAARSCRSSASASPCRRAATTRTRDTLGVSDFVAAMLRRGTKTRSADDISHAIDFVGGTLDAQATNESTNATCTALAKDAKLCLDLLSDILLHPSFPGERDGRGARRDAGRDRGALRQSARAREQLTSTTCCSARSTPTAGC